MAFIFKLFLVILIFFNMTTLKFSLGLLSVSFFFNMLLYLIVLFVILHSITLSKFSLSSATIFLSVVFLCISATLNFFFNFSFMGVVQFSNSLLPWLVLIMLLLNHETFLYEYKSYWSWLNTFLFVCIFIGVCEYVAAISYGYRPPIMKLDTGMGEYYVGYSTLFQKIPDLNMPYYRFQGPFGEAGDLAMWSSVFLIYNLIRQKYFYAFVFVSAIFFSFSPSAYISLSVAFLIFIWSRTALILTIAVFFTCVTISVFMGDIVSIYSNVMEAKVTSLGSRFSTVSNFIREFSFLINSHPLGAPFFESAVEKSTSRIGFSITYGPIGAYMMGGLIAFFVYVVIVFYGLILSGYKILLFKGGMMENELYIYYLMLFTYIIQRSTLIDYAIFPFLFAPLFMGMMPTNIVYDKVYKIEKLG